MPVHYIKTVIETNNLKLKTEMKILKNRIEIITLLFGLTMAGYAQAPVVGNGTGCGNALNFNGTTNYVDCGANASLAPGVATLTAEAWVNFTNSGSYKTIIDKRWPLTNSDDVYSVMISPTNQVYVQVGGSNLSIAATIYLTSVTVLQPNEWYHIALVVNSSNPYVSIYINGVPDITSAVNPGTINTSAGTLNIGRSPYSGGIEYFLNRIDEVRIWNTARTQNQIRDSMCKKLKGTEAGLMGYWRLDEGTGTTTADATVYGNTGTLH